MSQPLRENLTKVLRINRYLCLSVQYLPIALVDVRIRADHRLTTATLVGERRPRDARRKRASYEFLARKSMVLALKSATFS
jgi:hypothetical protein